MEAPRNGGFHSSSQVDLVGTLGLQSLSSKNYSLFHNQHSIATNWLYHCPSALCLLPSASCLLSSAILPETPSSCRIVDKTETTSLNMLEIAVASVLLGSLGFQTVAIGIWLHWHQGIATQQQEEEEEILTRYDLQDLKEETAMAEAASTADQLKPNGNGRMARRDPRLVGWEFKIVRGRGQVFRDPVRLQQLCEEEAEAGWILLEKLDDSRVRFKRPIAMRQIVKPEFLSFDPYRCQYGSSWNLGAWLGAIAAIAALILPAYLGYLLVSRMLANENSAVPARPTQPLLQKSPAQKPASP